MDFRDDCRGTRSIDRERHEGVTAMRGILIGLGAAAVFWTAAVVGLIVLL
ncbi:hypothetical protein GCM10010988_28880 [Cnuibacter physcomitrellae]|nr:hypothetical protein [Cnuibacter physcomitrellae]GGI40398.1 hypothetical protein GCM10010988_28880 [Cnuibacter physcomitrellae]